MSCPEIQAEGMLAATLVLIHTYPFVTDVRLGNVNSFQFCYLPCTCCVQSYSDRKHLAFMGGTVLGVMSVLKPNLRTRAIGPGNHQSRLRANGTLFRELAGMLCSESPA